MHLSAETAPDKQQTNNGEPFRLMIHNVNSYEMQRHVNFVVGKPISSVPGRYMKLKVTVDCFAN